MKRQSRALIDRSGLPGNRIHVSCLDKKARHISDDVVQHDGGNNLIDVELIFQKTDQCADEHTGCHADKNGERLCRNSRKIRITNRHGCHKACCQHLTGNSDVEQACFHGNST